MFDARGTVTTGAKHERKGTPGQDAVRAFVGDHNDVAVAIVADGAGSREHSQLGSAAAVRGVADFLGASRLYGGDGLLARVRDAFVEVQQHVLPLEAAKRSLAPKDLATTLSVAVMTGTDVVVASVGDGVQIVRRRSGALELCATAPPAEFANVTDFVNRKSLEETLRLVRLPAEDVESVLLSSDGLEPLLVRGGLADRFPFGGVVHALLDSVALRTWRDEDVVGYLRSDGVRARTDDDCSLAILRRVSEPGDVALRLLSGPAITVGPDARWPSGRRAWPLTEVAGLHLIDARIDDLDDARRVLAARPNVWRTGVEHPLVCWPTDIALDEAGAHVGFVAPRPGGQPLVERVVQVAERNAVRDGIVSCVTVLHDAGHAHGALRRDCFTVDRRGHVQLADPFPALIGDPAAHAGRLERDHKFLERVERDRVESVVEPVPA